MNTLTIKTDEYGEVYVNHNGDWSGLARFSWLEPARGGVPAHRKEVWLPGRLLRRVAMMAAGEQITHLLTNAIEEVNDAVMDELQRWEPPVPIGAAMADAAAGELVEVRLGGADRIICGRCGGIDASKCIWCAGTGYAAPA